MTPARPVRLDQFVQDQFRRGSWWSWETVIEEVARTQSIALTADRMTLAGGAIRTGPFAFHNRTWGSLCSEVVSSLPRAREVVNEVTLALTSPGSEGAESRWYEFVSSQVNAAPRSLRACVERLRHWDGAFWREGDTVDPRLLVAGSVYGLWRLGEEGTPITRLPHYIGRTGETIEQRIAGTKKGHMHWWGARSIGVTFCALSAPDDQVTVERAAIDALVPLSNGSGSRLQRVWPTLFGTATR
jgi:hypothetical protein